MSAADFAPDAYITMQGVEYHIEREADIDGAVVERVTRVAYPPQRPRYFVTRPDGDARICASQREAREFAKGGA